MKRRIGVVLALAASAFVASTTAQEPRQSNSLIVVGDPQLHNYLGGHLFQTTPLAARFSKVAQRFPEMNLLGGYAFDEGVSLATALPGGLSSDPIVLLGDGTNAACTGEYDRFMRHMEKLRSDDRIFLWSHGNHDTYLVGTTNTYPPTTGENGSFDTKSFHRMQDAPAPVNASYWKPGALTQERAWSVVCHDGNGSLPMNKSMWMARYLESFGDHIKLTSTPLDAESYRLEVQPMRLTKLAARDFKMLGRWYPPPRGKEPMQGIYDMYDSYLVQAIDIGDKHRLILIDTSTCGGAKLTLLDNAGSHGCVNADQIEDIETLAKTDRTIVYGGHYHFDEMRAPDRTRVLASFNRDGRKWTYLSAHTHKPREPSNRYAGGFLRPGKRLGPSKAEPRYEINVGSTTDWPMQAHRVNLDGSEVGATLADGGFSQGSMMGRMEAGRSIAYQPVPRYKGTEVCRHLDAAKKLAEMDTGRVWSRPWLVERQNLDQCERNLGQAQRDLAGYEKKIEERMTDPSYREAAFAIMRGASEKFSKIR